MIRKLSLLLGILMMFSCKPETRLNTETGPRIINPGLSGSENTGGGETEGEAVDTNYLVPMIDIPENEHVQKLQDTNLDDDSEEEQIILTSVISEEKNILRIHIADYDNDNVRYRESLIQDINAEQLEGLSINLQDLTGNQTNELYITGFTDGGFHTIDAFAIASQSGGLKYNQILSLSVNGTIDIQTAVTFGSL